MKADKPWYRGPCICGAGPYHKTSCPCHVMYLAKKRYEASISAPKELAEKVAKILIDNGFVQWSRKYKQVKGPNGVLILDPTTFQEFRELFYPWEHYVKSK